MRTVILGPTGPGIRTVNLAATGPTGLWEVCGQTASGPTGLLKTVQPSASPDSRFKSLIIPGYTGGGGGGYVAKAVHFAQGSDFTMNPSSVPPSNLLTIAVCVKIATADLGQGPDWFKTVPGRVNAGSFYDGPTDVGLSGFFDGQGFGEFTLHSVDGVFTGDVWHTYFGSWDLRYAPGSNLGDLIFDGIDVATTRIDTFDGTAHSILYDSSNSDFGGYPSIYNQNTPAAIEMCDLQIWLNQRIAPTPTNLAKFFSGGKPVDPAVAAAAFGPPKWLFSGTASDWLAQAAAQGFVLTGTLSNATTSPSD